MLPAKLNTETRTYDGIDLCAERVVQEIDEGVLCSLLDLDEAALATLGLTCIPLSTKSEIERIQTVDGGVVTRFSIVG